MNKNDIDQLVSWCELNNVQIVRWVIYYDNDENHFDEIFAYRNVDSLIGGIDMQWDQDGLVEGEPPNLETMGWEISEQFTDETGVFLFRVATRTFERVADAWMPDPQIIIDSVEPEVLTIADVTGLDVV